MAESSIERIQVVLEALSDKFNSAMDSSINKMGEYGEVFNSVGELLKANEEHFANITEKIQDTASGGEKLAIKFRKTMGALAGFRMEMLGVMFFGQMLQRTFMGFLNPVMEAYGVFELFQQMLLIVFLPVMELLFPILLGIMEWFMNLPESVQMAIGVIAVIGAVFGWILGVLGALGLGLGSLFSFILTGLPVIGAVFSAIGTFLAGLTLPIIALIAVILLVIGGMAKAFEENFLGMKQMVENIWNGIATFLQGVFNVIGGIIDLFIALITLDFEGMWKALARILGGVAEIFVGAFTFIASVLGAIVIGIIRVIWGIFDALKGLFFAVVDWIIGLITGLFQWIIDTINWLINTISGLFGGGGGGVSLGPQKSAKSFEDFIWRPGSEPIAVSPSDTIVGTKSGTPGGIGEVIITNNFYGFTSDELDRKLDERDTAQVDAIRRLVKE